MYNIKVFMNAFIQCYYIFKCQSLSFLFFFLLLRNTENTKFSHTMQKDTIKGKIVKVEEEKFKQLSSSYLHLSQNDAKDKDSSFRIKAFCFILEAMIALSHGAFVATS